ncbi:DUF5655 domain-containing protein [Spirosoma radiotolerans]|uniref:DUF5655 domain-containing protein n=1 Tax=Spirosoma radiotolerans TaxID=1379870 RepID=A0A0E3V5P1_9BACT|nr:DUF5655 domain-containing protein [Spirosoma radiotolerans]AKD53796.1 hypothetical protein SD10_01645 [Spirosoma radiotolerans]
MTLFTNSDDQLTVLEERPFKLERDIQTLFEANLLTLMSLELVKSEFTIKSRRIDTLAFDASSMAFVIIEYKRDRNVSVVDQGFTYLSLMLENRADFIVEYSENLKKPLKRNDVDWSQSRVVFVSPSFTENQIQATNFKDIAIELWEIKRFQNGIFVVNQIKKTPSAESVKTLSQKNNILKKITDEIKVYTEQDHINKASYIISELYEKYKNSILNLSDSVEVNPQKWYVAFKKVNNFAYIEILKKSIRITINLKAGQLDDPKGIAKDVSNIGHRGYGDYLVQVDEDSQIEYIMSLVKQAI